MFSLTREVRFAVNRDADASAPRPTNSYAGYPSLTGFGTYLALRITLGGPLDDASNYLVNIRDIDARVRELAVPLAANAVRDRRQTPATLVGVLFERLKPQWPGLKLRRLELLLSPFLSFGMVAEEAPMVRLSQKFEFSATHRLHNPSLDAAANQRAFGKCNNPHGHGHNYELQVTLVGPPNSAGVLLDVPAFESIVATSVIDRFDHKNLNVELEEFADLIPTVENIARVIHGLLKPALADKGARLASVTVWETPKTWCEYGEE